MAAKKKTTATPTQHPAGRLTTSAAMPLALEIVAFHEASGPIPRPTLMERWGLPKRYSSKSRWHIDCSFPLVRAVRRAGYLTEMQGSGADMVLVLTADADAEAKGQAAEAAWAADYRARRKAKAAAAAAEAAVDGAAGAAQAVGDALDTLAATPSPTKARKARRRAGQATTAPRVGEAQADADVAALTALVTSERDLDALAAFQAAFGKQPGALLPMQQAVAADEWVRQVRQDMAVKELRDELKRLGGVAPSRARKKAVAKAVVDTYQAAVVLRVAYAKAHDGTLPPAYLDASELREMAEAAN